MRASFVKLRRALVAAVLQGLCLCSAAGADEIRNVATLTWTSGGSQRVVVSNPVVLAGPERAETYSARGFVFAYGTGEPITGARISLVEQATGRVLETVLSGEGPIAADQAAGPAARPLTLGMRSADAADWLPGAFAFSPAPAGMYYLYVVPPRGMRIAAEVPEHDTAFLAPDGSRLDVSTGSRGEPFELARYGSVDLDIPLEPMPAAQLSMEKLANVAVASFGDLVDYQITIRNESASSPALDVVLHDVLPAGFSYVGNSLRVGASALAPVTTASGISAQLGDIAPGATLTVAYSLRVGPRAPVGQAVNRASVTAWDDAASASAEASVRIEQPLLTDGITIVGRVTSSDCNAQVGVAGIRIVMESGAYALTDASGFYHFEGVRPGAHVVQMDTDSLPPGASAATCGSNTRRGGSAISQFVEVAGGLIARADFHVSLPVGDVDSAVAEEPIAAPDEDLFAGLQAGIGWILPAPDHNPRAPALRVAIKHGPSDKVRLSVNGKPVPDVMLEGVMADASGAIVISTWRGVVIEDGDNTLEAAVTSADGEIAKLSRTVHYANIPARAVIVEDHSKLIADGASRPVIAARILDAAGKPVRMGVTGGVRVSSPYRLAAETDAQQTRQLAGTERFAPVFRVIDDTGLALIELDPTTQPGWVELTFTFPTPSQHRAEPVRAWLAADREDWILVGFAAGTTGFDTLANHSESLPDGEGGDIRDGQVSLYAKGRVLGRWLLTLAYDSAKRADESSLLSAIDPDRYYSLYGDASSVGYDAASAKKLYLRLERDTFYAMFGDFETGFTDTQLARYSRTLTGVKAESAGDVLDVAVFAAETAQRNVRDVIAGDGTSGPYRLSSFDIVTNTDHLRIETRDRLRSERVLDTRELVRHIDYEIDHVAATITFRQPVLSKDAGFNPVYIVAEYETWAASTTDVAAGARASARFGGDALRVGVTVVDDQQVGAGRLAGADLFARFDASTTLRLEGAVSESETGDAGAWLAEAQRTDGETELLAYARRQDEGFGLGQAPLGQSGSEKAGVDLRHKLDGDTTVIGAAWRERALATDAERLSADMRIERRTDDGSAVLGARVVADETPQGETQSNQVLLGASRWLLDRKLEVTGSSDVDVGSSPASSAFPTRHRVTAAYALTEVVRIHAGYEYTPEGAQKGSAAQLGFDVQPWSGARLSSTLSQTAIAEHGPRTFAQYGLSQSLPIGERWTVDATYDSGRRISGPAEAPAATTPISTGAIVQQDFDAVTAGATYRAETWSLNGRMEYRAAEDEDRVGLLLNSLSQLNTVTSVATSVRSQSRMDRHGRQAQTVEGRASVALRPADSPWTVLARTTLSYAATDAGLAYSRRTATKTASASESLRIVGNLSVNFDEGPSNPWTGSVYMGSKYVVHDTGAVDLTGRADVVGGEIRHDLGAAFDVGFAAAARRQGANGAMRYTAGPALGWSPVDNVWVSVGYNVVGFHDRDFSENRYTRKGAYLTFRFKFDQTSLGIAASGEAAR